MAHKRKGGRYKRALKRKSGRVLLEERFAREERRAKDDQANHRRKMIGKMDRDTALLATREFAKLGLFQ